MTHASAMPLGDTCMIWCQNYSAPTSRRPNQLDCCHKIDLLEPNMPHLSKNGTPYTENDYMFRHQRVQQHPTHYRSKKRAAIQRAWQRRLSGSMIFCLLLFVFPVLMFLLSFYCCFLIFLFSRFLFFMIFDFLFLICFLISDFLLVVF